MTTKLTASLLNSNAVFPAGTALVFQQSSAPTGWTKSATHNDKSLRVVSGSVSSGGSVAFSTAFASQAVSGSISVSGTVGSTTLDSSQIPAHAHTFDDAYYAEATWGNYGYAGSNQGNDYDNGPVYVQHGTYNTGGGGSHNHSFSGSGSFSGTAINLAVNYVDTIIATKD